MHYIDIAICYIDTAVCYIGYIDTTVFDIALYSCHAFILCYISAAVHDIGGGAAI
jgi:hypothetical protein